MWHLSPTRPMATMPPITVNRWVWHRNDSFRYGVTPIEWNRSSDEYLS